MPATIPLSALGLKESMSEVMIVTTNTDAAAYTHVLTTCYHDGRTVSYSIWLPHCLRPYNVK